MMNIDLLSWIAEQMMADNTAVEIEGKSAPIRRTSGQHLKTVKFTLQGHAYTAIEQNPEKPSRSGQLAREGHQVVQFKDDEVNKFVAVAIDGQVREYSGKRNDK